ncbi:sugar ABC transporter ATP-binding protein [Streptomyces sp. NPDC092296]|uniref:sugar ABC transporter ATP-binding protein n=1 Tax=Streptomyces sp. NPDC092296 TaxID=3366012 RepID=UPI003830E44D
MAGLPEQPPVAIRCRNVSKTFGSLRANSGIDLDVRRGTIHALVGENGAGKSTLLGMVSGRIAPSDGSIEVDGQELPAGRPRAIRALGIMTIYQEVMVVPSMTAVDNVFLGQYPSRAGTTDTGRMAERYAALCARFGVEVDPHTPARELSIAHQQILELMRGVNSDARVLLLDEPTAALAEHEREKLFGIIRGLRDSGVTVVLVSHNLEEVLALSDTVTVLRDGRLVRTAPAAEWDKTSLIRAMAGRERVIEVARTHTPSDRVLLRSDDLRTGRGTPVLPFSVHRGEVVGLWGLVGSGRTSFLKALAGLRPDARGELELDGERMPVFRSVRTALAHGIAMLPEDRKTGLVLQMNAVDNIHLGKPSGRGTLAPIRRLAEEAESEANVAAFRLDTARLREPVGRLSGGNQQKALFAKWRARQPRVLLIDEPTRGVDVSAKTEILAAISALAATGAGVVVTSSELEEVLAICDRLLIFAAGSIVEEMLPDDPRFTPADIVGLGFQQPTG